MRLNVRVDVDYSLLKLFIAYEAAFITLSILMILNSYFSAIIILGPIIFLVITVVFSLIFSLFSHSNYIEISDDELRFRWLDDEKVIKTKYIHNFLYIRDLYFTVPMYKIDRVATISVIMIIPWIFLVIISPFLSSFFKKDLIVHIMGIILTLGTIFSLFLPPHTGRKVLAGHLFSDFAYCICSFILMSRYYSILIILTIVMTIILITSFIIGYHIEELTEFIPNYLIIEAPIENRTRTIIVYGKVNELTRLKDELTKVTKDHRAFIKQKFTTII